MAALLYDEFAFCKLAKYAAFAAVCGGHKTAHPCAEFKTDCFTCGVHVGIVKIDFCFPDGTAETAGTRARCYGRTVQIYCGVRRGFEPAKNSAQGRNHTIQIVSRDSTSSFASQNIAD